MQIIEVCKHARQVYKNSSINADMELCKYSNIQVCKYTSMLICKYLSMLVCKFAHMQVCRYDCMKVYNYVCVQLCKCKVILGRIQLKQFRGKLCKIIAIRGHFMPSFLNLLQVRVYLSQVIARYMSYLGKVIQNRAKLSKCLARYDYVMTDLAKFCNLV